MNTGIRIETSDARPLVDDLMMRGNGDSVIALQVKQKFGLGFSSEAVREYRREHFEAGKSAIHQIIKVTKDIANNDLPPDNDRDVLAVYFSFKKTTEDLDLVYDRIRKLKTHAEAEPEKPSYDKRIKDYLAQAEAIRTRVFRHQYENIRKALLLTIGKKLCLAAVSILMPYINPDKKDEALRRFQSAIEPLLDAKAVPDMPEDILKMHEAKEGL